MPILLILFFIFLFGIACKLFVFGVKAAWSITKLIVCVFFWPIVLVVLAMWGFLSIAFPVLIVIGIVSLIRHK